jgi:ketosteroid isomerase-like protein
MVGPNLAADSDLNANGLIGRSKGDVMSTDFDTFFLERNRAAEAYVKGDGEALDALVPHDGEATFFSPLGDDVIGAGEVARRYLDDSTSFSEGATRFEVLQKKQSGDLAFWAGYEITRARVGATPDPEDIRIRVTEIFQRVDETWKLVHRHAENMEVHLRTPPVADRDVS